MINEQKEVRDNKTKMGISALEKAIDYSSLFPNAPFSEKYSVTLYYVKEPATLDIVIQNLAKMHAEFSRYFNRNDHKNLVYLNKMKNDLEIFENDLEKNAYDLSGLFIIRKKDDPENEKNEDYIEIKLFIEKIVSGLKSTIDKYLNKYENELGSDNVLTRLRNFLQELKQNSEKLNQNKK